MWSGQLCEILLRDIRYAVRQLRAASLPRPSAAALYLARRRASYPWYTFC